MIPITAIINELLQPALNSSISSQEERERQQQRREDPGKKKKPHTVPYRPPYGR
jgi:hypothetical protein